MTGWENGISRRRVGRYDDAMVGGGVDRFAGVGSCPPFPIDDDRPFETRNHPMRGWLAKLLGTRGERTAARYLKRCGYQILDRNYRNSFGEIDLIARDSERIVFVEVKTRSSIACGLPVEAVDVKKQRQMTRVALAYLKRHNLLELPARFDVIALLWTKGTRDPQVTHYENAFEAVGSGQMFS